MLRKVTNSEYQRLVQNDAVDLFTMEELKNIPRNRVVMLEGAAYNVHSLRQHIQTSTKNPLTGGIIRNSDIARVKKLAQATGWRTNSWNTRPSSAQLTRREQRAVKRNFVKRQSRLVDRRITANNTYHRRVKDIAKAMLTDTSNKYMYRFPTKGVVIHLKKSTTNDCIDGIDITWTTRKRTKNNNNSKFPKVHLQFPRKYVPNAASFIPEECIKRNELFTESQNIEWTIINPQGSNPAPGSQGVSYQKLTLKLAHALGFKTVSLTNSINNNNNNNNNNLPIKDYGFKDSFDEYLDWLTNSGLRNVPNNSYSSLLSIMTSRSSRTRMFMLLENHGMLKRYANALTQLIHLYPKWGRQMSSRVRRRTTTVQPPWRSINKIIIGPVSIVAVGPTNNTRRLTQGFTVGMHDHPGYLVFTAVEILQSRLRNANSTAPFTFTVSYVVDNAFKERIKVIVDRDGDIELR
jgi:hypothetical protein